MRPVPEFDPKAWLMKALRETAHAMERLVWELDARALCERLNPDEWSCTELLWHMAEMERRYVERLEAMVYGDEPPIPAFDADSIGQPDDLEDEDIFGLLEDFGMRRQQSVYLLWSLDERDWQRKGVHPYLGPLTVQQVAREMNEHDLAHLWQLRRLCDRLEAASV